MTTATTTCPECRHPMSVAHVFPAAVIAEYVVEHRVLSGNRFDPATVTVAEFGTPSDAELARIACERLADQYEDSVQAGDLRARQTRKRIQRPKRVMTCTCCTYEIALTA